MAGFAFVPIVEKRQDGNEMKDSLFSVHQGGMDDSVRTMSDKPEPLASVDYTEDVQLNVASFFTV